MMPVANQIVAAILLGSFIGLVASQEEYGTHLPLQSDPYQGQPDLYYNPGVGPLGGAQRPVNYFYPKSTQSKVAHRSHHASGGLKSPGQRAKGGPTPQEASELSYDRAVQLVSEQHHAAKGSNYQQQQQQHQQQQQQQQPQVQYEIQAVDQNQQQVDQEQHHQRAHDESPKSVYSGARSELPSFARKQPITSTAEPQYSGQVQTYPGLGDRFHEQVTTQPTGKTPARPRPPPVVPAFRGETKRVVAAPVQQQQQQQQQQEEAQEKTNFGREKVLTKQTKTSTTATKTTNQRQEQQQEVKQVQAFDENIDTNQQQQQQQVDIGRKQPPAIQRVVESFAPIAEQPVTSKTINRTPARRVVVKKVVFKTQQQEASKGAFHKQQQQQQQQEAPVKGRPQQVELPERIEELPQPQQQQQQQQLEIPGVEEHRQHQAKGHQQRQQEVQQEQPQQVPQFEPQQQQVAHFEPQYQPQQQQHFEQQHQQRQQQQQQFYQQPQYEQPQQVAQFGQQLQQEPQFQQQQQQPQQEEFQQEQQVQEQKDLQKEHREQHVARFESKSVILDGDGKTEHQVKREQTRQYNIKSNNPHHSALYTPMGYKPKFMTQPRCVCYP